MLNLIIGFLGAAAFARAPLQSEGFVELKGGRQIWREHKPARFQQPTIVLGNGLTYVTGDYQKLRAEIERQAPEIGIVAYDMRRMGQSARGRPVDTTIDDQVDDAVLLREKLWLTGRVTFAGLSYGGAVALKTAADHPEAFDEFVAMAPFLSALPDMDHLIEFLVAQHRVWVPLDLRTNDELYDHYLRWVIFTTFPASEPVALRNFPFGLENIFRMVKGARHWLAERLIPRLPLGKVHYIFARKDEYVPIQQSEAFAAKLPPGSAASVTFLKNVRHKIPEEAPRLAARLLIAIARGDYKRGLTRELDGSDPAACETLLGNAP